MAITTFNDSSTTAASNIDVNGTSIQGTAPVSNFDNALRELMAIYRRDLDNGVGIATKTGNYTALATDNNAVHRYTATATVTLTAAATLGRWHYTIVADGANVVIDPNGAETIDGKTTLTVLNGASVTVFCDGSNFRTNLSADQRGDKGYLYGLTISNNASDAVNDIDIASGEASSDGSAPYRMILTSTLTKRLDAAWAVGSGNGGLDTGAIANGTYHVWLIRRSDTGVVDALFSASATSPTMPANYDQKAYLWPIIRSGATILGFKQVGNAFTLDLGVTERSSTAAFAEALFTLTAVPTGVAVSPMLMYRHVQGTVGNVTAFVASASKTLDAADQVAYTAAAGEGHTARVDNTFTNTSAQVKLAVTISSGTLAAGVLVTRGWVYPR